MDDIILFAKPAEQKLILTVQRNSTVYTAEIPLSDSSANLHKVGVSTNRLNPTSDSHPFSLQEIAFEGASGVEQGNYPNCWFEACLAALAQLPRGRI